MVERLEIKNLETLLINGAVWTPTGWIDPGYLAIKDGLIQAVGGGSPTSDMLNSAAEVIDVTRMAVMPGVVNGHTHLSQTFMRGLAAGRPLLRWLKELIWPLQAAISAEELELAAMLGLAENIRSGATMVVDHQKITRTLADTQAVARAAAQSGVRCTIARAWSDCGNGAETPDAILIELEELFVRQQPGGLVQYASGPLTPWRCSEETLRKSHALALEYGSYTHMHVSETADEVQMTVEVTGLRPVAWLDQLGILGPQSQIVHAVWVDDHEMQLLAQKGALVVHCPLSNAVLGSGIARVRAILDRGVQIRLGTDGPASNDTQDSFENLKAAISLARANNQDAAALSPREGLSMLTAGAQLTTGSPADLILVRLDTLWSAPVHDIDSALALSTHGSAVDSVMVAGKFILRSGKLLTIDEESVIKESILAVKNLRKRAGLDQ
jgi:5-methylthioadenosine/S-adenosylhomocysteine deaminase